MEDSRGNQDTYIHQKKKNLWGSPSASDDANSTVKADRDSRNMSPPAAPSNNGCQPASMLESIPGQETPDPELWSELKYMCDTFFPGCDFDMQFSRWKHVFPTYVMVGAFKRCFIKNIIGKNNIMHAFSYILKVMQSWNGPGIESGFDRNMHKIPVAAPEPPAGAPAVESAVADPHAEYRANHNPAMMLEWMKDNNVSMENNPPKKDSPNGKLMDEDDYNRRLSIRARDIDRFRKLAMDYYCPSLILEREA